MTQNYEGCYFCNVTNPNAVEEHHIVPQRYNGSDEPENTVDLCGACHNKIENELYTDRFYQRLGVAVDELETISDQMHSGTEVDPRKSKDRKIPQATEHVMFEQWVNTVYVSDIRSNDVSESVAGLIEKRQTEILETYENHVKEQNELEQSYDTQPDIPTTDGVPPVRFKYDHDLIAQFPVLIVKNPHEDYIDWGHEDAPEYLHETKRKSISDECSSSANPQADGRPEFYRMHCAYCHTAYTQHQHSDMARHLRVRHGIDDPYEHKMMEQML